MTTKIISDRCIKLSKDENGCIDITSANILYTLVMSNGSKILEKFEEHRVTGREIAYLNIACGFDLNKLSSIIINGSPFELLSKVKESKYYLDPEQKKPTSILKFIGRK